MVIASGNTGDIEIIKSIAERTWWPTYSPILTPEQLRYMLDSIYSEEALLNVMTNCSQEFILLTDENEVRGFASFGPRPENSSIYKLHKLYVLPGTHGKGYGKSLLEEVKKRIRRHLPAPGTHRLELNVNRFNPALAFYKKSGFEIIREEDIAIGPYWMNDYLMGMDF